MTVGSERIRFGLAAPVRVQSAGSIADATQTQLFAEILTAGPLSRTELARRADLSQSTVTKVVNPLIEAGYVVEVGARSSGMGRPHRLLRVATDRYAVIGVKIAPGSVTGVLADLEARVLAQSTRLLTEGHHPVEALEAAVAVTGELAADPAVHGQILGLGVGLGGHVDPASGRVLHSGVLGWDNVDVAEPLAQATGLPTVVDNDVNALAIAERWFGAGRDIDSFVLVTTGPGVGCGLLLGGQLYPGATGLAGELGHIPLQANGVLCDCGNRGCLETVASDRAVLREIAEHGGTTTDIDEAIAAARAGDERAMAAFEAMGTALGLGLATVCNLFNPQRIVLTGERASAYDLFGPACEQSWREHAFSTAARDCELVVDHADDLMWARGAGCLVIREAVGSSVG
ncbi:ROK family transcriptional regulator [Catenulispora yoronensis]|uniref:ROK family transcriptional regulator n=1 Tax=Catenulispora yoronensis TaxID=450799 RepID=A0ABN2TJN8_9ACTN